VGTASSAPYSVSWNSQSVADGTHTIAARALDPAGNPTTSSSATVTVSNADTTPPTSTISCNAAACANWYNAAVSVSLSATDNPGGSGVKQIRYTTNGTDPTATTGTVYSGVFSVGVTTTVKYRAFDNAGNAEAVNTQLIQIDTVAPASTIACNGTTCSSSYYTAPVSVTLAATDTGGSGVQQIRYTTDGSDPTTTNGTVYNGAFTLSSTTTVKYRAFDNAGNAEAINAPLIRVDTVAPTSTISCNGASCASAYKAAVSVSLLATDNSGGSGVQQIRYTTNGSDPTSTTGTVYSAPFTVSSTTTVKYRAFDNAGNAEAVNTRVITLDTTAPTVTLTAPANGAVVGGSVTLTATATDNIGVDHVDFLVDGSVVGTASSSPYSVSWNSGSVTNGSHSITARAVDTAGNSATSAANAVTVINGTNLLQNPSLELASGSTPTCWLLGGFGNNTVTWTRTSDAHTGSFAEKLDITSYTDGDRKLVNTQDTGSCAPAASPGRTYTVTVWYKSGVTARIFVYYRNSTGVWTYWTSASFPASSNWTRAVFTTPAVPSGATNLSVGMGLSVVGSVTMDDLGLFAN
jgi:Bacterial Ig domain/Chitobiase/beta-hexosaminidase C-terminal domain